MKQLLVLIVFIVVSACTNNDEIAKETDKLFKEFTTICSDPKKPYGNAIDADAFQKTYLKLDILLEKYPKADQETITIIQEYRNTLKDAFDFIKDYEMSAKNVSGVFSMMLDRFTQGYSESGIIKGINESSKGLNNVTKEIGLRQRNLEERLNKLTIHLENLKTNLCKKYQLYCQTLP
ncbi:MAG: hypothetical protein RIT27_887 [Pseudomonadota bacterium]|jgi:hypothetical protein